ncbi:MAG: hypothetical protein GY862_08085 [Gammaproteobacteria bacterium]|nr:hypothetical protein [Gammaproteobacteria bacterium]
MHAVVLREIQERKMFSWFRRFAQNPRAGAPRLNARSAWLQRAAQSAGTRHNLPVPYQEWSKSVAVVQALREQMETVCEEGRGRKIKRLLFSPAQRAFMAGFAGKIKASWKNMLSMLEELLQEAQMNIAEYSPASRGRTQQVLLNPLITELKAYPDKLRLTFIWQSALTKKTDLSIEINGEKLSREKIAEHTWENDFSHLVLFGLCISETSAAGASWDKKTNTLHLWFAEADER